MKVGIIGAMEQEVTLLRDQITNNRPSATAAVKSIPVRLTVLMSHCSNPVSAKSPQQSVPPAAGASKPDVVINTGSAGGLARI